METQMTSSDRGSTKPEELAIGGVNCTETIAHRTTDARGLADIQASLRLLAEFIAQGAEPNVVFAAVTKEILRHFGTGTARMIRYETDGTATILANEGTTGPHVRVGERWEGYPPNGLTAVVWKTGRTARVDDYRQVPGGEPYLKEGLRSAVGMPIYVHGQLWGMVAVGSGAGALPADTEQRMSEFTDLVATAVASAQSRAELELLRARITTASDEVRRSIERDLHDGVQQRLVALVLRLRTALDPTSEIETVRSEASSAANDMIGVITDLREISRGIHPSALRSGGLAPALDTLARRSSIPVDIDVRLEKRLPQRVEAAAYYVAAEMLTNAAKHANASSVWIQAEITGPALHLRIRDDGGGGADATRGSGLDGLKRRIEMLGGTFWLDSPPGCGTTLHCGIPTNLAMC
jgi:signal transduction histidine kinase